MASHPPWLTQSLEQDEAPQRRRPSATQKRSPSVWSGAFAGQILDKRQEVKVVEAPAVTPWRPRTEHFYRGLQEDNPRRYIAKGKHASYGGSVTCHPQEAVEPVHVDPHRDSARKRLEPGAGLEFSGGSDLASCIIEKRDDTSQPRGKGRCYYMEDGDWVKKMQEQSMYFTNAEKPGHQAPGGAIGAVGRWGPPPGGFRHPTLAARQHRRTNKFADQDQDPEFIPFQAHNIAIQPMKY